MVRGVFVLILTPFLSVTPQAAQERPGQDGQMLERTPESDMVAQNGWSEVERLRPTTPQLERLVDMGYWLSPTFRDVVDGLQELSVIVQLVPGVTLAHGLDGALHFLTTFEGYRYLSVSVRTDLEFTLLIAVIAHELQHAIEIGQAPSVVDVWTMRDHYQLIGVRSCLDPELECYDTTLARKIGNAVYTELPPSSESAP